MIYRRLQTRREYAAGYNNGVTSKTTHSVSYQGTGNTGPIVETTTVLDPSGNVMSEVAHTMQGSPLDALNLNATGCNNWNEGLETQTQYGSSVAVTVMNTPFSQSGCMSNPQIQTRSVTLNDTGQQSSTVFAYDSYGNVNDQKDYDWGVNPATGSWLRHTTTTYLSTANAAYASVNLVRLPYVQAVMNASGNAVAQTDWRYDEETPQSTPGISTSSYTPPATTQRGNLTSVYQTLETSSGNVSSQYRYNSAGNVVSVYDPNGNDFVERRGV